MKQGAAPLAALSLLFQLLAPQIHAAPIGQGSEPLITICTSDGAVYLHQDGTPAGKESGHRHDCCVGNCQVLAALAPFIGLVSADWPGQPATPPKTILIASAPAQSFQPRGPPAQI